MLDLIVKNGETVELFCTKNKAPYTFNSILVKKNGILTVNSWDPDDEQGGYLYITCKGNITLRTGAAIDLTGKGYTGGSDGRSGESIHGITAFAIPSDLNSWNITNRSPVSKWYQG